VIVLDLKKPHLTPLYNLYSHLVYAAKSSDVTQVIINGKKVLKDRQLMTAKPQGYFEQVGRFAEDLKNSSE